LHLFSFEPFSRITSFGSQSYDAQWSLWFSREFNLDFYLYWILAALLFYVSYQGWLRVRLRSKQIFLWRKILLFFPAVFCWYGIHFQTLGVGHYEDEISYLYQARLLARAQPQGLLLPEEIIHSYSVPNVWINRDGRLVGSYSIGYPLLLAPFDFMGCREFFPILLCFLSTLILFKILGMCFSRRRILPYLLVAFNPWFALFSAYYFSQSLVLLICSWILLRRLKNHPFIIDWGLVGSMALIRPPDALIMASALFCWQILMYWRKEKLIRKSEWMSPGLILLFLPLHFLNQKWITGSYFLPTYAVFSKFHKLGFSEDVGIMEPWGYNLSQAIKNLVLVLLSLNDTLFGWPALSLLPIVLAIFVWKRSKLSQLQSRMLRFSCLLLCLWFGFYFFYFYPGICLGPRFHFPLLPVLIGISAFGILGLGRLRSVFAVLSLLSLWNCFQWQDRLKDSGGVWSRPLDIIEKRNGLRLDESMIYVIKEDSTKKPDLTQRSLFAQFYQYNDPFDIDHPRFLRIEDYTRNPGWFQTRYGNRLRMLEFKTSQK